jgi:hypothetical protein
MKTLLIKFRLSNALDQKSGAPLPDSLGKQITACPELRDFAQRAAAVDRALRNPPVVPSPDETLHRSIMRAVRVHAAEPAPSRLPMKWGLAAAFGAVAVGCVWLAVRSPAPRWSAEPSEAQKKEAVQVVMEIGGELSRPVPVAVVAPLSNEWASVDHDIRNTTRFILAALP